MTMKFCCIKTKKKNADMQNSTFANPNPQTYASLAKELLFLRRLTKIIFKCDMDWLT